MRFPTSTVTMPRWHKTPPPRPPSLQWVSRRAGQPPVTNFVLAKVDVLLTRQRLGCPACDLKHSSSGAHLALRSRCKRQGPMYPFGEWQGVEKYFLQIHFSRLLSRKMIG